MPFDTTDYSKDIDALPDNSSIAKAVRLGGVFVSSLTTERWHVCFGGLPRSTGNTQIEAAQRFLRYAETGRHH